MVDVFQKSAAESHVNEKKEEREVTLGSNDVEKRRGTALAQILLDNTGLTSISISYNNLGTHLGSVIRTEVLNGLQISGSKLN